VRSTFSLTEVQRDALQELANVGAGHAATSLSGLLSGERISFQPPEAWVGTQETWMARLGREAPWVAGVLEVQGAVGGALWLLFGERDGEALAARLYSEPRPEGASVDRAVGRAAQAMGASALLAMGSLAQRAFLAVGEPVLRRSGLGAPSSGEAGQTELLVLEVRLRAPALSAHFLFLPEGASRGALLGALRV
jgi:chemotaxis protein CheC